MISKSSERTCGHNSSALVDVFDRQNDFEIVGAHLRSQLLSIR